MKRRSSRFYLAVGLTSLLMSVLMAAIFLGIVPDRDSAVRSGHAALGETLAVTASALLVHDDRAALRETFDFVRQRNPDIVSIGLRNAKGELVVNVGGHAVERQVAEGAHSTDTHMLLPLLKGNQKWGSLEIEFTPLQPGGWYGAFFDPRLKLLAFVIVFSFLAFYFYLRRTLRHLDPSRAIPARVRAALDTLAEGLLVLDQNGYIVLANVSFADVLRTDPESLIGRSAATLDWRSKEGLTLDAQALPWIPALKEGIPQRNQIVYLDDASGSQRTFRINCTPVLGAGKKQTPVLVSLDDVTELEEKELELRAAMELADSANRAKSDFLANMSHEIRTPMNAILGFTELLKRGFGKNEQDARKHLNTIHSSGQHLLELINDILDLSKVEAGRMDIERINCSPVAVMREVVRVLSVRAAEKGIALDLAFAGPLPERVVTDPSRLRQIITNLVGNALKFTERGGVTVTASLTGAPRAQRLQIAVSDTGIGIPPEKIGSIFEAFSQADNSIARRFGGTGLGLTISRQLAGALGGDITVQSTPGKVSVFTVTIDPGPLDNVRMLQPSELEHVDEPLAVVEQKQRWQFPPVKVLVVDDGAENRELVRLVLNEAGVEVVEAENGQVAVDLMERQSFGCVLMDVQMPVMDGVTATRLMRSRGSKVPIIALTANLMKGFDRELGENGFSGYLAKPIEIDALLDECAQRLGGTRIDVAPAASEVEAAAKAPQALEALAAEPIVSRLANHPRLQKVVLRFVSELPSKVSAMQTAAQAGNMAELAALAHWLKGTGGTMGFDAFFEPARDLEEHAKANNPTEAAAALAQVAAIAARVQSPAEPDQGSGSARLVNA